MIHSLSYFKKDNSYSTGFLSTPLVFGDFIFHRKVQKNVRWTRALEPVDPLACHETALLQSLGRAMHSDIMIDPYPSISPRLKDAKTAQDWVSCLDDFWTNDKFKIKQFGVIHPHDRHCSVMIGTLLSKNTWVLLLDTGKQRLNSRGKYSKSCSYHSEELRPFPGTDPLKPTNPKKPADLYSPFYMIALVTLGCPKPFWVVIGYNSTYMLHQNTPEYRYTKHEST